MLINGDDVARCGASFRESKWLEGHGPLVMGINTLGGT
jgi:hypothetical protein